MANVPNFVIPFSPNLRSYHPPDPFFFAKDYWQTFDSLLTIPINSEIASHNRNLLANTWSIQIRKWEATYRVRNSLNLAD
jgi:hypothetical protein